jgi:hypothetical protein
MRARGRKSEFVLFGGRSHSGRGRRGGCCRCGCEKSGSARLTANAGLAEDGEADGTDEAAVNGLPVTETAPPKVDGRAGRCARCRGGGQQSRLTQPDGAQIQHLNSTHTHTHIHGKRHISDDRRWEAVRGDMRHATCDVP